ncbi:MAG: hypothetical protein IBJ12_01995 [Sphingomonadaceae bacterium]|nr:hypothetical protein [Sphingomonadaceae bacterium]
MAQHRSLELQMYEYSRNVIVERHMFFVREAKNRLLNQFDDIEGEADRYQDEAWQSAMSAPYYGDEPDIGSIAQAVTDDAAGHYMLLDDMRKQVRLSTVAAMFHQWDKELRDYLENELRHYFNGGWIKKHIWNGKTIDLFDLFEQFGWTVRSQPFYPLIDACNLIVNVYKHGKGAALTRLHNDYPHYLSKLGMKSWTAKHFLDHKWLEITDADFDNFAQAFEAFWRAMPERLVYHLPEETAPV